MITPVGNTKKLPKNLSLSALSYCDPFGSIIAKKVGTKIAVKIAISV